MAKIQAVVRGNATPAIPVVEFYLDQRGTQVSLMAKRAGVDEEWFIATINPNGKMTLESGIPTKLGLDLSEHGRITIEK